MQKIMYTFEKKLFWFLIFFTRLFHCRWHCHIHTHLPLTFETNIRSPLYIISFRFNRRSTPMTFATSQWYTLTVFGKPWLYIFLRFYFYPPLNNIWYYCSYYFFPSFLPIFFLNRIMVFIAFYWRPDVAQSKSA